MLISYTQSIYKNCVKKSNRLIIFIIYFFKQDFFNVKKYEKPKRERITQDYKSNESILSVVFSMLIDLHILAGTSQQGFTVYIIHISLFTLEPYTYGLFPNVKFIHITSNK